MAKIKIPFHLCDPAQILFFGSFYEIYHQYLEEHITEFGIKWSDWFKGDSGGPIRGLKTSYNQPLHFGVNYQAELSVIKIGDSTVTFRFEVFDEKKKLATDTAKSSKKHSEARVTSEITHCFVDKKTRDKVSVPKLIKQALSKHLVS